MKVAIYGAGSLGTILGAYITKAGIDIDLINRNKKHIAALKEKGAQICGKVDFSVDVNALLPEEMKEKYDIIFLMTKQTENKTVVEGLLPYLNDDGVVCTMQNGLPELLISEIIGEERTFGCVIGWGATMKEGGICELTSEKDAVTFGLGSISGHRGEKYEQIKKLLECMGTVEEDSNFIGARWSKLLINSAFSGMSAVLGCTFGEVCDNKLSRLCAQKIIKECIEVTKAGKIIIEPIQGKDIVKLLNYDNKLKQKISFMIIPIAMKKHRALKASMLQDLEKGKKCEIDAINGVVSQYGKKVGVPTPYNDKVVEIIRGIEEGKNTYTFDNLSLFSDL
jgi:2-dehydropantoate 2-reductase